MEIRTTKSDMYKGDQDKEGSPMEYVSIKGFSKRGQTVEKKKD